MGIEDMENEDQAMSAAAIVEGDATLVMMEHMTQYGNPLGILADMPKYLMMNQQRFYDAPAAVQKELLFPYIEGMNFFTVLAGRTRQGPAEDPDSDPLESPSWRNRIFHDPPTSTEQIIHPEKYLAGEAPAEIALLTAPEDSTNMQTVIGEFGIRIILESTLGEARARETAAGWNGDRLLLFEDEAVTRRTVHWVSRWDNPEEAAEFTQALFDALQNRLGEDLLQQIDDGGGSARAEGIAIELNRPAEDTVEFKGTFEMSANQ